MMLLVLLAAFAAFFLLLKPLVKMAMESWGGLLKAMLIGGTVYLILAAIAIAGRP